MYCIKTKAEGKQMPDEKKEIIERIAKAFPKLSKEQKIWVAGYISCAEESCFMKSTSCEKEMDTDL